MANENEKYPNKDEALLPAKLLWTIDESRTDDKRLFQGIPTIERTPKGKIYSAFYTGTKGEGSGNYVMLLRSENNMATPAEAIAVVEPPTAMTRCFDPCLWIDNSGRLWFFYAQSYTWFDGRVGVWAMVCDDPDAENLQFSAPRRIGNGIMMNKPIILSSGEWLLPCSIWEGFPSDINFIPEERFSNVYRSADNGATFEFIGHSDYKDRLIDENVLVEKNDGTIWMLIRGKKGIGEAFSKDKGVTWVQNRDSGLGGPCSRFACRRLKSGNLILVNHHNFKGRNNLKAMLSRDDGKTWEGYLMLDERDSVSYPDLTEDENGNIYIIHDFDRNGAREILMSQVTEEDILAGKLVSPQSRLKVVINKATGVE